MLKELIPLGSIAVFGDLECEVLEVLSDNRLRLSIPVVDGQVQLMPLYSQSHCLLKNESNTFETRGEILERYKSANRYVMEIELKEGLYKVAGEKAETISDDSVENQKKLLEKALMEGRKV